MFFWLGKKDRLLIASVVENVKQMLAKEQTKNLETAPPCGKCNSIAKSLTVLYDNQYYVILLLGIAFLSIIVLTRRIAALELKVFPA